MRKPFSQSYVRHVFIRLSVDFRISSDLVVLRFYYMYVDMNVFYVSVCRPSRFSRVFFGF